MYKKQERTESGQISVEAAIIVPICMMVIVSLIYMAFYSHDIVSVRSGGYAMAIEHKKGKSIQPSLFVITPKIVKEEKADRMKVNLSMTGKGNINFINKIINSEEDQTISVQKTMNTEILYIGRALLDVKKEGGD